MRSRFMITLCSALLLIAERALSDTPATHDRVADGVYGFTVESIDGDTVDLAAYKGMVSLVVNVATECGFTPQLEDLDSLYRRYGALGFVVLGFPANNFMNQAPGSNQEILAFCTRKFSVTFPLFSKVSVKGDDKHPLYAHLSSKETNPEFGGEITWNFNKFLVGRDGKVVDRFGSATSPGSPAVVQAIEEALTR